MLINIQFLRMVAAMLVVFYHTSAHVRSVGAEQGAFFAVNDAIGFAGVDIFFVISGFIMAHTSFSAAGWADGWSFLRRRLARIYSGYWPFFLLALALFACDDLLAVGELAAGEQAGIRSQADKVLPQWRA